MLIATLVKIIKKYKQPKYPSVDERVNKMWYILLVLHYLVKK